MRAGKKRTGREVRVWGQEDRKRSESVGTRDRKRVWVRDEMKGREVRVWGQEDRKRRESVGKKEQEEK